MRSDGLSKLGFGPWHALSRNSEAALMQALPVLPGVYVIRQTSIESGSDIIYIGSATNRNGLCLRIRQYYHPGPSQSTNHRILKLITDSDSYEICHVVTEDVEEAIHLECELLARFRREHGTLPAQNRQMPGKPAPAEGRSRVPSPSATIIGTLRLAARQGSLLYVGDIRCNVCRAALHLSIQANPIQSGGDRIELLLISNESGYPIINGSLVAASTDTSQALYAGALNHCGRQQPLTVVFNRRMLSTSDPVLLVLPGTDLNWLSMAEELDQWQPPWPDVPVDPETLDAALRELSEEDDVRRELEEEAMQYSASFGDGDGDDGSDVDEYDEDGAEHDLDESDDPDSEA